MQTISLPVLEAGEYAGGIWYYEPTPTKATVTFWDGWASTRWCASASTPVPPSPVRWTPP